MAGILELENVTGKINKYNKYENRKLNIKSKINIKRIPDCELI